MVGEILVKLVTAGNFISAVDRQQPVVEGIYAKFAVILHAGGKGVQSDTACVSGQLEIQEHFDRGGKGGRVYGILKHGCVQRVKFLCQLPAQAAAFVIHGASVGHGPVYAYILTEGGGFFLVQAGEIQNSAQGA